MKSSGMGGIPSARFANHAPPSLVFFYATVHVKQCRHLSIIAHPPATGIGLITIPKASSCRAASAPASNSVTTTTSALGELSLGLVDLFLVDRLGAFRDAMIRIPAIKTSSNAMFLWNIPLI